MVSDIFHPGTHISERNVRAFRLVEFWKTISFPHVMHFCIHNFICTYWPNSSCARNNIIQFYMENFFFISIFSGSSIRLSIGLQKHNNSTNDEEKKKRQKRWGSYSFLNDIVIGTLKFIAYIAVHDCRKNTWNFRSFFSDFFVSIQWPL